MCNDIPHDDMLRYVDLFLMLARDMWSVQKGLAVRSFHAGTSPVHCVRENDGLLYSGNDAGEICVIDHKVHILLVTHLDSVPRHVQLVRPKLFAPMCKKARESRLEIK
jgi:hypothetical protein